MKRFSSIMVAAFGLISLSAFADENPLYVCNYVSPPRISIPEYRMSLEVSAPDSKSQSTVTVDNIDFINCGKPHNVTTAFVTATPNEEGYDFVGETENGQNVELSVTRAPGREGGIGLFAPRYTALLQIGSNELETWSCHSPRDPQ